MLKVGFYIENASIKDIDLSVIKDSNPGIGGTEYAIASITQVLAERDNDLQIFLFSQKKCSNAIGVNQHVVSDVNEMLIAANVLSLNYIVINYRYIQSKKIRKVLDKESNVKFIIWCHNFVCNSDLNFFSNNDNIVKIITVGREQLDIYRDHKAFRKSAFIYNAVPLTIPDIYKSSVKDISRRNHVVTYIGSLVPCKGFLLLAKAWKQIIKAVPDAELYVIGGGNLYSMNTTLGSLGVAAPSFEAKFLPFITINGHLMPSVHFMGVLGAEKNEIFIKTKVGVPNPGGQTETFGITAVEMQLYGCKVTTKKCAGYLDTVYDKTQLYCTTKKLADYVIRLLLSNNSNYDDVYSFLSKNFSFEVIAQQWEKLFLDLGEGVVDNKMMELHNPDFMYKKTKERLRILKEKLNLEQLPSIDYVMRELPKSFKMIIKNIVKSLLYK